MDGIQSHREDRATRAAALAAAASWISPETTSLADVLMVADVFGDYITTGRHPVNIYAAKTGATQGGAT